MQANLTESRVRYRARKNGFRLCKSRARNPHAIDYGSYWLIDPYINGIVYGGQWGACLEHVAEFLDEWEIQPEA